MTLKDIIDDLAVRLQHTLTENDIVRYVNYALNDVRRIATKLDIFEFNTFDDLTLYPIPTYITGEGIKTVTVDGTEYFPKRLNEVEKDCTYHVTPDGYINLYPKPKNGVTVYIAYEGISPLLTLTEVGEIYTDLTEAEAQAYYEEQDTGIDDEYAQLIPLSVAISAADIMEDVNLTNNFRGQYNVIYQKAQQGKYLKRGKYPTTRMVQ